MNFHKTIGYLAALLLMVGLGVPDSFAQSITIKVPTAQRSLQEGATDVTVTVNVTITGSEVTDQTKEVTITGDNTTNGNFGGSEQVALDEDGAGSGAVTVTVNTLTIDPDRDDNVVTLTATANIGPDVNGSPSEITSNEVTITIVDTQADLTETEARDVSGFRVTIAAPAPTGWAKVAENAVKVQVHRYAGLASEWGNYASIQVALHDEFNYDDDGEEHGAAFYSLIVTGATQLGSLVLASMKTDSLAFSSGVNVGPALGDPKDETVADRTTENIIAYTRRRMRTGKYDTMEFRFNIPETENAANLLKAYAVATFTVGGNKVGSIDSRDTDTTIYPSNPSDYPDKVGDGKLIRIDRDKPAPDVINSMSVAITDGNDNDDDDVAGNDTVAGIGDEIEITAGINGSFRDHSVVFQIIAPDLVEVPDPTEDDGMTTVIRANGALVGFSKTFSAADVFSAGRSLSHEFKVTANQFKRKYTANSPTGEPRKYNKNDLREDDGLMVRARAAVKDQAGNSSNQYPSANAALTAADEETDGISNAFMLDSKPPKVTILYPKPSAADSNRFTAKIVQDYEFLGEGGQKAALKPLKFEVDEGISASYVVIDGNHATRSDTLDLAVTLLGGVNTVDLSDVSPVTSTHTHRVYVRPDNGNNEIKEAAKEGAYNKGTKTAKLTVAATDMAGNLGKATPSGGDPIFDNKAAVISKLFPNNTDLADYDQKIGGPEGTQHPVFRLNEAVDSINVRYEGNGTILSVVGSDADNATVNNNIRIKFLGDNALQQGEIYDMQVYVRDLAGHVTLSDGDGDEAGAQPEEGLTFDNDFSNPQGGAFKLSTHVQTFNTAKEFAAMDSVVANQGMRLDITALDAALTEASGEDRVAITYNKAGVQVGVMDSDGNPVPQAKFWGGGVPKVTGTTTLDDLGWSGGKRSIFLSSTRAGSYTIAVKDMNDDGTVNFMQTTDIVVDAADFSKIVITAWEEGVEGPATQVWGDFDLLVTPTDAYGNPSLKTFNDFDDTGKVAPVAAQDSLDILDTRVGKDKPTPENAANSTKKYSNVDVNFSASLIEDLPFSWSIAEAGDTFSVRTQEGRTRGTARVRAVVDNGYLLEDDVRSRNKSGDASFTIGQPLEISITLWVPGEEGDQAGNTVTTPAGESIDVTARAEGLNEGDTVTFTTALGSVDVTANADGHAPFTVPLSGSGAVTVTATSGQYSASLDVVYEEAPAEEGRKAYVDSNGDPVYLIAKSSGEVGVDDFLALVAAFGSSEGDDNYNVQADINDDGSVGVDDFLAFIGSFGKTAAVSGKPIVLLPGINENAEFSLSLGSDRVVAGELMAVDVSLANVEALIGYGFALNYDADKFEFVSVASADEDLLTSTGGETLFHHVVADGQISVATGMYNGTAVSGGGDIVQFVFRVLYEFEDNARFEIADGLVFDPSQLQNPAVVAGVLELQSTPKEFALHQNFPNPFNPDTTIKYDLSESADVTLQIYNVLGQVVRTLVASEAQNAGRYQIRWNGMDDRGVSVSSGIYFYRISAGEFQNVRKLMLLK